jgi:hypothetical protein
MATVAKVNSDVLVRGTLYSTLQLKVFEITPAVALTSDTQAGGEGTAITEGTIRQVANALSPMLYQASANGAKMVVVMDGHHSDAASLKVRIDQLLGGNNTVAEKTTFVGLNA